MSDGGGHVGGHGGHFGGHHGGSFGGHHHGGGVSGHHHHQQDGGWSGVLGSEQRGAGRWGSGGRPLLALGVLVPIVLAALLLIMMS